MSSITAVAPALTRSAALLALEEDEREKPLTWVPVIKDTIEKAQQEAEKLAAK